MTDDRTEPFIRIKDSLFENLGYQQTLAVLSNLNEQTTNHADEESGVSDFFNGEFNQYDHRGYVLNIDSFPGAIQIQGSQFKQNMAYIQDYVLEEN